MFAAFNLDPSDGNLESYKARGENIFGIYRTAVERNINNFEDKTEALDGGRIINNWFPSVEADVFISHSHADRDHAVALAGYLDREFNLRAFVDSTVWGYAADLLKLIDSKYCLSNREHALYDYDKRNISTSHVHMMLSTALMSMMNKCECIIFINTPNSIRPANELIDNEETASPWIYSELLMTSMLKKRKPNRTQTVIKAMIESRDSSIEIAKPLKVKYQVDLRHLNKVSILDFRNLEELGVKGNIALDTLYSHNGITY